MQIEERDTELEDAFLNFINAKKDADRALLKLQEREQEMVRLMEAKQRKSMAWTLSDQTYSATYTQRTTTEINEKGLRKALTARVYDKYTVKKLDRKSLENAMSAGVIDPSVVAQYVEQVPGKTYLTYRVKDAKNEESEDR